MNTKVIALSMACVMIFSGCHERGDYDLVDAEKAGQFAIEYMNSKYNQDFELISSKKDSEQNIVVDITNVWVDVYFSLKGDDSGKSYHAEIVLDENDKSKYRIKYEDYTSTEANPVIKLKMDEQLDEFFQNEHTTDLFIRSFDNEFQVPDENDTLCRIMESGKISLCYNIVMPESSYYSGIREDIRKIFTPCMSDNDVNISLTVYNEEYYDEYKNSVINGDKAIIRKSVSEENIYINGDKE